MAEINVDDVFFLITYAGNSRSNSSLAIQSCKNGDFEKADEYLAEAHNDFVKAHSYLSKIVTCEINSDEQSYCTTLAVHAQDHLTMATLALDNAKEFMSLYRIIYELKNK